MQGGTWGPKQLWVTDTGITVHSSGHTFLANLDFRKAIKGGKKIQKRILKRNGNMARLV